MSEPGLVLVGTPIGNLGDLSPRAAETLAEADAIACEDTRRTGSLCAHVGIEHGPFIVCNEHREAEAAAEIVARIGRGEMVALVTDAGMPAISDPGQRVVRAVVDAGLAVRVVPGPTAVVAAVAASGLPTDRFAFEGFLPRKGAERQRRIGALVREGRTTVFYEAPHRIRRTLADLQQALGPDRPVAIARELTKRFEEIWRGTLADAAAHLASVEPRGEYVLVLGGAIETPTSDDELRAALRAELEAGASTRDAVDAVVEIFSASRRRVYELALDL